jgi:hypothetical protein
MVWPISLGFEGAPDEGSCRCMETYYFMNKCIMTTNDYSAYAKQVRVETILMKVPAGAGAGAAIRR